MASIEQTPPATAESQLQTSSTSAVNSLLARVYTLNWEAIFYFVMFAAAVLTRFINLGDRVMSHDESLHTKFSYDLYKTGNFQHTPLMHGPVLFHAVAFFYFLFGDSDFSARLYPAVLGILMVMMPRVLFERWLGKRGAMVATVMILISPMLLYHARYIREDTPSMFYTLIMFWAILSYIYHAAPWRRTANEGGEAVAEGDEPKKKKRSETWLPHAGWLLILSGAMLLSLASKEVAFMYIAIFGSFLTLFWLVQVMQGVRRGETLPIVGWIIGGILGLGILGVLSVVLGTPIANALGVPRIIVQVIVLAALGFVAFAFQKPIRGVLGNLGDRALTTMQITTIGLTLGVFASLIMIVIVSIIPIKDAFDSTGATAGALLGNLIAWTALLIAVCLVAVIGTAIVAFRGRRKLPWIEMASIFLITVVICGALLWAEERSKNVSNVSSDNKPAQQFDPNNPAASTTNGRDNMPIYLAWAIGAAACAGLLALRFLTPFFQEMRRYPAFDILVVIATLILPWLTSIPMFLAGYTLDAYPASQETIQAGIASSVPFIAVAVVGGLCWNPGVWIACAVTFYSIFAFFFTTIFTNPQGIVSGAIGSLGYWLAQQGVRRGSQPQYYYLLIQLPMYEFLPVIGSLCAGVAGLLSFWRFRAGRHLAMDEARAALIEPAVELPHIAEIVGDPALVPDMPVQDLDANMDAVLDAAEVTAPQFDATQLSEVTGELEPMAVPMPPAALIPPWLAQLWEGDRLTNLPALGLLGYWAVMITYAFTISGEKMPWLTTHLTLPMILITGWFLGTVLDKVSWPSFFKRGWMLLLLTPIFLIAAANLFGPFVIGDSPFAGLSREQLLTTGAWFFALIIVIAALYAIGRIMLQIGIRESARVMFLGVFLLLGVLTARAAWRFAYIDYDYATEFGVYAHGAPAMKTVMNKLKELSLQTTDGMGIKVAYDNDVSWPGSWYFREYPNSRFLGDPSGATDLDNYAAILVSAGHRGSVEPQLGDRYYKYDFIRLWWPMQDYFDLTANRVNNVLMPVEGGVDPAALRHGLWDIWWNRDYQAYATATNKNLDVSQWPVADRMTFFVRKDIASQVWDMGVGGVSAESLPTDPFTKLRCDTCVGEAVIGSKGALPGQLDNPHGVAVGPNGNLYVVDTRNQRIVIYDKNYQPLSSFGTPGDVSQGAAPGGTFHDPWGVAVAKDGSIYVADTWNHRVQKFNSDLQFQNMWGRFETSAPNQQGSPDGFWGPRDIAVDANGNVYVADTGNKRVRVYDKDGNFLRNIGSAGAAPGNLNEPVGLAIDDALGRIYVADTWNKRIQAYTLDGNYIAAWPVPNWYGSSDDTGNRPYLTLDKTGTRLFATEPDTGRVLIWDVSNVGPTGGQQPILVFGAKGTNPDLNHFGSLGGIATDATNHLYVVDSSNSRLVRFLLDTLPGVVPLAPVSVPQQAATEQVGDQSGEVATQPVGDQPIQAATQAPTEPVQATPAGF